MPFTHKKIISRGINYCLVVAKQYIYVAAKMEDPFCLVVTQYS